MHRFRLPSLALGLGLAACAKGPAGPQAVRSDSAGVEIVVNSGADRAFPDTVTVADTLYDPAADSALQGEARMLSLGSDASGRLVVADGGFNDRRILRAGSDGEFRQVGRRGGGPGEYQMLSTVAVSPDGEILAGDYGKRAYLRFGPGDSILPPIPWSAFGTGFAESGGYAGGGVVAMVQEMSESSSVHRIKLLTAADTVLLAAFSEGVPKQLMYESCRVGFMGAPLFTPRPSWSGNRESVALATSGAYEIRIWRGGKLVRIIRRAVPTRAATRALAVQDVGEGFRIIVGNRGPCTVPPEDIVNQQGFAGTIPAIKQIVMAADGTLWVERWTIKGEPLLRDIFDPAGNYLGTLTGDVPWPKAWLPDGRYVSVGADADSLPVVVRYAVGGGIRRE
ncbi:MAG TPA: hypothetical protein VG940_12885 [Gemmatimonadales bacterium]|nr:hypothetical protein [Gemmatimonadales bacterium]